MKHSSCKYLRISFLLSLCLCLGGCFGINMVPQSNDTTVIKKTTAPVKEKKYGVLCILTRYTTQDAYKQVQEFRKVLENNGIKNYEFVDDSGNTTMTPDYVMRIEIETFGSQEVSAEVQAMSVSLNVTVFDARTKSVLAKVAGNATDSRTVFDINGCTITTIAGKLLNRILKDVYRL